MPGCQSRDKKQQVPSTEGVLLGLCMRLCLRHREWPPALDGLWEAAWVGGPGIGESSGAKMFLLVRASKLWPGLAPSGSSGAGGMQAQVGRVTHDCTVGLYVS